MKKYIIMLFVILGFTYATDLSFRMGDKQGVRLGFNLSKIFNINVGVDYRSEKLGINYQNSLMSIEYSQMMPVIGTKFLVPLSTNNKINIYLGADYYWSMPSVKFVNINPNDPNASKNQNEANTVAQDYLVKNFSNSGFNFYLSSEYYLDDKKGFALLGMFGVQMDVKKIGAVSTGQFEVGFVQTITQLGFNYFF